MDFELKDLRLDLRHDDIILWMITNNVIQSKQKDCLVFPPDISTLIAFFFLEQIG